jgi:hypothetical protein
MLVFVAANLYAATPGASVQRPAAIRPHPATQTAPAPQVIAIGSSAIWLELGQASAATQGCSWTIAKGTVLAYDSRVGSAPGTKENGAVWITWSPGTASGSTCANPDPLTSTINLQMNTDSVVGNRCYFANPRCTVYVPAAEVGVSGANSLTGFTDTALPASIQAALTPSGTYGIAFNTAATDIRPEDAKFASLRLFTACGTPVVTGSQYLGLGYATGTAGVGNTIEESTYAQGQAGASSQGSFHVFDFNLMGTDPINGNTLSGSYSVTSVGAVPVVVFVNPSNENGFGSLLVSNVNRAVLAGYLDGTYGRTSDIVAGSAAGGTSGVPSTVFVREPLSGTYNTMEYAIPNSVEFKSGQDLGLVALNANPSGGSNLLPANYCSAGAFSLNPLDETASGLGRNVGASSGQPGRHRAIGTGDEVAATLATEDALGYSFWSAANFAKATATTGKYLTVDGIDPLQESWTDGLIPTSGNGLLGNVSFAHIKDGSYPIWSILRLVSDPGNQTAINNLVSAAANFLTPSQPDFVHASQLQIVRSHFAPPGVTFPGCGGTKSATGQPANGTGTTTECGGDVGGSVYGIGTDKDYNTDNGTTFGYYGQRQ